MKNRLLQYTLGNFFAGGRKKPALQILATCLLPVAYCLSPASALAQSIVPAPDGTGTTVIPTSSRIDITGGKLSGDGANLFHSFSQFNLKSNEIANFLSTPTIHNILSRIQGGSASYINGLIQVSGGNSNLYLMNPSGIVFGSGARLNVPASFIATTANGIAFGSSWFSAIGSNNYTALVGNPTGFAFTMNQPGGIINAGNLAVGEQQVLTLAAGTVLNTGTLSAPGGQIIVAAVPGENLVRLRQPDQILSLEIQPASSALASGEVTSLPPSWTLPIASIPQLLTGGSEENATKITANSDGTVQLSGSDTKIPIEAGTAIASGTLNVASEQKGGVVQVLGDRVGLVGANINASGNSGGGTVLIGGDYQGRGRVPNAAQTYVSSDTKIVADALLAGNGGRVIVWSDKTTSFLGKISARGGSESGNGGFVETSGKEHLQFAGVVDTTAPFGQVGTLLLDPKNILIQAGGTDPVAGNSLFSDKPTATSIISGDTLSKAIDSATVTLQANNDITVKDDVTGTTDGNGLTLQAGRSISIDPGKTITLNAGNFSATINDETAILSNRDAGAAQFATGAGSQITTNHGVITVKTGTATADSSSISLSGTLNSSLLFSSYFASTGAIALKAAGNITINKQVRSFANGSGVGGDITVESTGGAITIDSAAPLQAFDPSSISAFYPSISYGTGGAIALTADNITPSNITTRNNNVTITGPVTLPTSSVTITTRYGSGSTKGNVTFKGTIDGNSDLTVQAGTTGTIQFDGLVGGKTPLSGLSYSALNLEVAGGIILAKGSTQTYPTPVTLTGDAVFGGAGTNAVTFTNLLSVGTHALAVTADQISFTGGAGSVTGTGTILLEPATASRDIVIAGLGGTSALELTKTALEALNNGFSSLTIGRKDGSGTISVNAATFKDPVTIQAPAGSITVSGLITGTDDASIAFKAGTTNLNADITTTSQNITIQGNTLLGNNVTLSSGSVGPGNILINGKIDGNKNLTLATGTGNISLNDLVGSTTRLNNLTVNSTNNLTADSITAASIRQNAGSGTTTFNGALNTNSVDGINLTGTNFVFKAPVKTTNSGGVSINNGGTLSIAGAASMSLDGAFNQTGTGAVSLGGNITAKNSNISFNSPVTLAGDIKLDTREGGNINFNRAIVGGNNDLTMAAGTGDITLQNATELGIFKLDTVHNFQAGSIAAASITQTSGSGTTTFNETVNATASGGVNLTGNNFVFNKLVTATRSQVRVSAKNNISAGDITANSGIFLDSSGGAIDTSAGTLDSSSFDGKGGTISLIAHTGAVTGGNLNSSGKTGGGSINVSAFDRISLEQINSSASLGNGGDVTLDPQNDISVSFINAQGGSGGKGGTVDITTQNLFRASDAFKDQNGSLSSISTAGGDGGGDITIRHGGSTRLIPFIVGNGSLNGTEGAITTGLSNFILPSRTFPGTYIQGNIAILTSFIPPTSTATLFNSPSQESESAKTRDLPSFQLFSSLSRSEIDTALAALDEPITRSFEQYLGKTETQIANLTEARNTLQNIAGSTGIKPALIYVIFTPATVGDSYAAQQTPAKPQLTALHSTSEQKSLAAVTESDILWQFNSQGMASNLLLQSATSPASHPRQDNDQLELLIVTAEGQPIRKRVDGATRSQVLKMARQFRGEVTNPNRPNSYLVPAQTLYKWLIAPIEADLQARGIQNLVFIMDTGLRSLPIAALHDGKSFLVEKYSVGLMPSLSLTDTHYTNIKKAQVLAMGADHFLAQNPLPAVPVELQTVQQLWPGKQFLNEAFTLENLIAQRREQPFAIVHLATHAEFKSGAPSNSYLQLWDTQLRLDQMRQLDWNKPPVELLVLSACKSALGNEEAELGFAGLAVQAGVKSAVASLWYVSDAGTLALMSQFYQQLKQAPIKAEALRLAQVAMLKGQVRLEGGVLHATGLNVPVPGIPQSGQIELTHPYYWAAFTMIGNPW